ncbi:MAG: hypothetical protein ACYC5F_02655 [Thermoleophilia bacterium]
MSWINKLKKAIETPQPHALKSKEGSSIVVSAGKVRDTRARELERKLAYEKDPRKRILIAEKILSFCEVPVDRHHAFNFLEKALYRLREEPGMMEKFESVCAKHRQEIEGIVPDLRTHDGLLLVLPMYKQMAIHKEKTGDLEAAIEWSEAGLRIYRGDCIKQDHDDDLRKRVQRLEAKVNT